MNKKHQDNYVVKSMLNGRTASLNNFSCIGEHIDIIQHVNLGSNFRESILKDLEMELLPQDPGCKLISVECLSNPDFLTKDSKGRNDPIDITEYLKVVFHLEVIMLSSSNEKWKLKIDLSYARTPAYKKDLLYNLKQDLIIVEHEKC